jgi:hypothetical protein
MFRRSRRRARLVLAVICAALPVWACNARTVQRPYCAVESVESNEFSPVARKLDLLFLIDNSSSTDLKQNNVICNFPRFIEGLRRLPGGLPDLHLGVVSSDLGSGAIAIPGCERPGGDDGAFQGVPHPQALDCTPHDGTSLDTTGCTGPRGKGYIEWRSESDNNVDGQDLARAFSCVAALGSKGCGYEAQLASVARALERGRDPADAINGGFLRDDALLAVVIVTDEDDCSLPVDSLLGDTASGTSLESPLGPMNHRCTDRGITCGGQSPPRSATGELAACSSNEVAMATDPRHALIPVAELAARLSRLKPPEQTLVEAIAGPPPPDGSFRIRMVNQGMSIVLDLAPSCDGGELVGSGTPAVRIAELLRTLDARKKVVPICQKSFAAALDSLAARIGDRLVPCLARRPLDRGGRVIQDASEADCTVADVQAKETGECRAALPRCGQASAPAPACLQGAPAGYERTCWMLEDDPRTESGAEACPGSRLSVRVCRSGFDPGTGRCSPGDAPAPPSTKLAVSCASCTPTNAGVECVGDGLDNDCDGQTDDRGAPCDCS